MFRFEVKYFYTYQIKEDGLERECRTRGSDEDCPPCLVEETVVYGARLETWL
jgi:hypothetical protein